MVRSLILACLLLSATVSTFAQNINANLCPQGPRIGNVELLSPRPTAELIQYLDGLKSGRYAFDWTMNGFQAASQLGFGKRFTATYGQMAEEAQFRIRRNGVVNINEMIGYLSAIIAEEQLVDVLTLRREQHFSSIVYLRALQIGECSFPYVFRDTPMAQELLSQIRRTYPELNLEQTNSVFANIYDQTIESARSRAKQEGSVSIYRDMEDWRRAITK